MKLTNSERLIISMLASLHEKLGIETETAKLISEAIFTGNTWALSWELTGIVQDDREQDPPEVKDVVNYLDMWAMIEEAAEVLTPEDLGEVTAIRGTRFPGFDGNNEAEHFSIARFLTGPLDRWSRFKSRDLNSHHQTLDRYERMYGVFEPLRVKVGPGRPLSKTDLVSILEA